jgi:hypothetical protein
MHACSPLTSTFSRNCTCVCMPCSSRTHVHMQCVHPTCLSLESVSYCVLMHMDNANTCMCTPSDGYPADVYARVLQHPQVPPPGRAALVYLAYPGCRSVARYLGNHVESPRINPVHSCHTAHVLSWEAFESTYHTAVGRSLAPRYVCLRTLTKLQGDQVPVSFSQPVEAHPRT